MSAQEKRLIIGMGDTGLSMAAYWRGAAALTAVDNRTHPPKREAFSQLPDVECKYGEDFCDWSDEAFAAYDLIALSPGISPAAVAADKGALTNDAACFSAAWQREAPQGSRLLAVTGSNGKSTVTELVAHLLRSSSVHVEAVGNIGKPMLDALRAWRQSGFPQVVVVELSSFHLELAHEFYSDAAVVLNVSGDHIDRHGSVEQIADIKGNIYNRTGCVVMNAAAQPFYPQREVAVCYAEAGEADWCVKNGWIHRGEARYCSVEGMSDTCRQFVSLVLAALALTDFMDLPQDGVIGGLASFVGLPHRRQFVANQNNVVYVNDSKATNVEAALFALQHTPGRVVWIGGGDGKGQDFSPLGGMAPRLRAAVLMGESAAAIEKVMGAAGVACHHAADMDAAVRAAQGLAQAGDTVLLSPACSSLDMFRNYHARGDAFAHAVTGVEGAAS